MNQNVRRSVIYFIFTVIRQKGGQEYQNESDTKKRKHMYNGPKVAAIETLLKIVRYAVVDHLQSTCIQLLKFATKEIQYTLRSNSDLISFLSNGNINRCEYSYYMTLCLGFY